MSYKKHTTKSNKRSGRRDPYTKISSKHQFKLGERDRVFSEKCCAKNSYGTRQEVKHAAKIVEKTYGRHMKVYNCPYCGMYHLTTRKDDE